MNDGLPKHKGTVIICVIPLKLADRSHPIGEHARLAAETIRINGSPCGK